MDPSSVATSTRSPSASAPTSRSGASVWNWGLIRTLILSIAVINAPLVPDKGLPAETSIERYVTIGAYGLLRSCTIEPECIIGQHSILMEGSLVETNSILEAGSVLPPGQRIPTGELWAGLPAETSIERYVTIGAYGLLRSCTIEPECIIGQHSILMEGSLVETNSILEAGSVLPPGQRIPTGELWAGNPARFVRKLTHEEILQIPKLAVAINDLMQSHFSEFLPYSMVYLEAEKMKAALLIPL
ncbi:hypothetical protein COCNU_scaffold004463G000050 [Cocos nucifera]|nr:hypothetical protein [Cocos nucifera]